MDAVPSAPKQPTLFGHPIGLFVLFFTEMWERFSYYGMRGLLKLYMVNYLFVVSRQILQGSQDHCGGDPNARAGLEFFPAFDRFESRHAARGLCFGDLRLVYRLRLSDAASGRLFGRSLLGPAVIVFLGGALMAAGQFLMAVETGSSSPFCC